MKSAVVLLACIASSMATSPCLAGPPAAAVGADVCSTAAGFATHLASCGCPYVYGGTDSNCCASKGGLDCSGLVYVSYAQAGKSVPRTSEEQYAAFAHSSCSPSNTAACSPGDLLFYCFGSDCPDHVVMYIGGGKVAECPHTGENCHVVPAYGTNFQGARSVCAGSADLADLQATVRRQAEQLRAAHEAAKMVVNFLRMNHLGMNATVSGEKLSSIPCYLCEKAVGFLEGKVTKVGCDFLFDALAAAACEAAGVGPEDPLSEACIAALIGGCSIILKLVEEHVTSTSHICAAIHLC